MQVFHARPSRGILRTGAALLLGTAALVAAHAQKRYDTGATDTSIRIGHLVPYSGPVSA